MSLQPLGYRTLLHDTLIRSAAEYPDKVAVVAGERRHTLGELDRWSDGIAATLASLGVHRGDRVVVFMDNSFASVASVYGVLKAGAVFLVVNPQTKAEKLAYIANDCAARVLIADRRLAPVLRGAVPRIESLRHVIAHGSSEEQLAEGLGVPLVAFGDAIAADPLGLAPPGTIPSDLAALIYTSGSTGRPKGVVHTHQSMVFALGSVREYLRLQADDVILNLLPLAFDYGLYQVLMAVSLPAILVLEPSFTYLGRTLGIIPEEGVTVFPGVPTVFAMLLAAHGRKALCFPSVRTVTNTAAALPADYLPRLREVFPNGRLFPMYGLTECKRVAYLEPELVAEKPGSVGRAIPGTEVLLRSPEGEPVGPGERGILHVRGPHLMRGYWNAPERTAEMLVDGDIIGEKWLRTGDWFRTDDEGFLYFLGRSDDIIKSRGEKVSPAEVEDALHALPGVVEAAVVGVPDERLGEAIKAFLVLDVDKEPDPARLRKALLDRLESFMVPTEFEFRTSLPKSENGKIRKRELV